MNSPAKLPLVAISLAPTRSPWGGSSPFVWQLVRTLNRRGYRVRFDLRETPSCVVMIDPRMDHSAKRFGLEEIRRFRELHPGVPVVHRVNECDQRKGTDDIDALLGELHALSTHTVFISKWLRDYFVQQWFDPKKPHSVIYNGADPGVFHPIGNKPPGDGPFIFVTHHWSAHHLKGFDVYREFDAMLAAGEFPNARLRVIGRWSDKIKWESAELIGPLHGHALAERLRECHIYLTASRWEPCGMHHVEGAQCGLPMLYHEDGGGIVEAGLKYGMGFRHNLREAARSMMERHAEFRRLVLTNPPSGDRMALDFVDLIQKLIVLSRP